MDNNQIYTLSWNDVISLYKPSINRPRPNVAGFVNLLLNQVILRVKGVESQMERLEALWQDLGGESIGQYDLMDDNRYFDFVEFVNLIKDFKVVYLFDVNDKVALKQMEILINFAFYGQFYLKETPGKGRGLYSSRIIDKAQFNKNPIIYGGRWHSRDYNTVFPERLQSDYILEAEHIKYPALKGFIIDGERYFKLGELGRWINHTSDYSRGVLVPVFYSQLKRKKIRDDEVALQRALSKGLQFKVRAGRTITKNKEILISYSRGKGREQWEETFGKQQELTNVKIDRDDGVLISTRIIFPNEEVIL
jgi:hypothetical protein